MSGVKLEADFHIITAQTNAINNLNKCVQKAGLRIDNSFWNHWPPACRCSARRRRKPECASSILGAAPPTWPSSTKELFGHTAVIPFGGDIISADIKQGCSVLDEQAELLKVKFGRAIAEEASFNEIVSIRGLRDRPPREISVKNLAYIIEARMQEIFELVHAEIIASGYEDRLAGGIVVTGGGSQLKQVKELCELMCASDARVGYPNEYLGRGKPEDIKSPTFATGVGLVLAGFKALDERNLDYVKRKASSGKTNLTERPGGFSFRSILEKTKRILIDDFNEKEY